MSGERSPEATLGFAGLASASAFPVPDVFGRLRQALRKEGVVGGEEEAGRAASLGTLVSPAFRNQPVFLGETSGPGCGPHAAKGKSFSPSSARYIPSYRVQWVCRGRLGKRPFLQQLHGLSGKSWGEGLRPLRRGACRSGYSPLAWIRIWPEPWDLRPAPTLPLRCFIGK